MNEKTKINAVKRNPVVAKAVRHTIMSAALLAGTAFAAGAFAIGFGPIEGGPALGQPLNVRIPIQIRPEENIRASSLLTDIPDYWEHSRRGIEPVGAKGIRPQVVFTPEGRPEVELTTEEPLREPVMNFLLRVKWPNGEMVKEYSMIVDLPGASVPEKVSSQTRPVVIRRPDTRARDRNLSAAPGKVTNTGGERRFGPVQPGDTLSEVVSQFYPGLGSKRPAATQALVEANPQAFVGGNPDRLIAGATLVLPPRAKLLSADSVSSSAPTIKTPAQPSAGSDRWQNYVVRTGDTLQQIAKAAANGDSIRTDGLMTTIVDANPQAFIGGDRDRLRSGATLRILASADGLALDTQLKASATPQTTPTSWTNYTVKSGDALSRIARLAADGDRSRVEGLMATIVDANPRAFIDGDRDRLRSGVTLRIPTREAQASSTGAASAPVVVAAKPSPGVRAVVNQATTGPQLLVERDELRLQLDYTLTAIDTEKTKQTAFSNRLGEAKQKIEALQARALQQDETITRVKANITQTQAAIEKASTPPSVTLALPALPQPVAATPVTSTTETTPPPVALKADPAETRPIKPVRTVAPQLLPDLRLDAFSPVSFGTGALLVALLASGYILRRRRKRKGVTDHRDHRPGVDAARARLAELREQYEEDSTVFGDPEASADNVVSINRAMAGKFAEEAVMAYSANQFGEAESLIQKAIKVDPSRVEYKELLACVYDVTNRQLDANIIRSQLGGQNG